MNDIATKVIALVLGSLMTLLTWFVKSEMTSMSQSLASISKDVQQLKQDTSLVKQEMQFRLNYLEEQITRK